MPHFPRHPHGQFAWVDLHATDQRAAEEQYPEMFAWRVERLGLPHGGHYTLFLKGDHPVAGCVQRSGERSGALSAWSNYVAVEDCDAVVERARALGGVVEMAPTRLLDLATIAFVRSPDGAVLGLWQPIALPGALVCNEPGSLSWNELVTPDRAAATAFFAELLGWEHEDRPEAPGFVYTVVRNRGRRNGGVIAMDDGWGEAPAFWMPYFAVSFLEVTVAKLEQLGGRVLRGPFDGRPGTWCVAALPSGEVFTLIALTGGHGPGPQP